MRRFIYAAMLSVGLVATPAFADGIEIQRTIRPTPGGDYVVRSKLMTTNGVNRLQFGVFRVSSDGRIGDEIKEATLRPNRLNTKPGVKNNVLVIVPGAAITEEQLLSMCMWAEPPTATGSQSQLLAAFRYCRLFTAKP